MQRRLLIVGVALAGLLGANVAGAVAGESRTRGTDWACIFVSQLDTGMCQQNPLPEKSPIPNEVRPLPAR